MKRATHITIGAAVAMPLAVSLSPPAALGAIWWGMVGGGFPDWLDLRSDFQRRLRHRGASHGFPAGAIVTAAFWFILQLVNTQFHAVSLSPHTMDWWTYAFGLGFLSHIVSDACTHAGVRPLLPFSKRRWWLLPRFVRGRSSGHIDFVARFLATLSLLACLVIYVGLRFAV